MANADVSIRAISAAAVTGPSTRTERGAARAVEVKEATPDTRRPRASAAPESRQQVTSNVGELNELIQNVRRELRFSIDDSTGETIIRVIDADTQEVVRQIPPEELIALIEHLRQNGQSLLADPDLQA